MRRVAYIFHPEATKIMLSELDLSDCLEAVKSISELNFRTQFSTSMIEDRFQEVSAWMSSF